MKTLLDLIDSRLRAVWRGYALGWHHQRPPSMWKEARLHTPRRPLPADPAQTVILVVEDEPIVLYVVRIMLERAGYFVLHAGDGEEALLVARQYPGTIHLLVTDILMPRLDGYGLREQMLLERPAIRILLMSGQPQEPTGGGPFLRKPFDWATLRKAVRDVLSTRRPATAA